MQATVMPSFPAGKSAGTGGFLDPENIVSGFNVTKGMKVADFGCGAGYFTILLAEKTGEEGRVYAVDVQEPALDNVRAKARANGLNNIDTIRANLEVMGSSGLTDNSQDMVLLANILFQSGKKAEIIKEAKRVLKSKGKLIIIDWKNGVNGFGPPHELRLDVPKIQQIATKDGFEFEHNLDAGQFHFGLVFKKQ